MSFRSEIESTQGLEKAFRNGMQALNPDARAALHVKRLANLVGSADIDSNLRTLHPQANRWDYLIGYQVGQEVVAVYMELHPASSTTEIGVVLNKAEWLRHWLKTTPLQQRRREIYWVATGRSCFNKNDPKLKALALAGVSFVGRRLDLN